MDFIRGNVTVEEVGKRKGKRYLTSYQKSHIKKQLENKKERNDA